MKTFIIVVATLVGAFLSFAILSERARIRDRAAMREQCESLVGDYITVGNSGLCVVVREVRR